MVVWTKGSEDGLTDFCGAGNNPKPAKASYCAFATASAADEGNWTMGSETAFDADTPGDGDDLSASRSEEEIEEVLDGFLGGVGGGANGSILGCAKGSLLLLEEVL